MSRRREGGEWDHRLQAFLIYCLVEHKQPTHDAECQRKSDDCSGNSEATVKLLASPVLVSVSEQMCILRVDQSSGDESLTSISRNNMYYRTFVRMLCSRVWCVWVIMQTFATVKNFFFFFMKWIGRWIKSKIYCSWIFCCVKDLHCGPENTSLTLYIASTHMFLHTCEHEFCSLCWVNSKYSVLLL